MNRVAVIVGSAVAASLGTVVCAGESVNSCVDQYIGVTSTYESSRQAFIDRYELLTGVTASVEDFESFPLGQEVGDMPGNSGAFAPEYADGSIAPLPIVQSFPDATSGSKWTANFGNDRPAGSSWVIRPDNPDDRIYAFAQTNAQGDWVRVLGYGDDNELLISIDAPNTGIAFVGFISRRPLTKVVITPLGNFDLLNGMDDVFVETTPLPDCADFTYDGTVDLADLNIVLANFGTESGCGDVNSDGFVNLADLNLVLASFGTSCF